MTARRVLTEEELAALIDVWYGGCLT